MASAKARLGGAGPAAAPGASCPDCAQVLAVSQIGKAGEGSAVGMIPGGVLGHQLGDVVGTLAPSVR